MPDPQPGLDESLFEREGAADRKGHEIIAPDIPQIGRLIHDDTVTKTL